jgi:hypothetical protein
MSNFYGQIVQKANGHKCTKKVDNLVESVFITLRKVFSWIHKFPRENKIILPETN